MNYTNILQNFEESDFEELLAALQAADDCYHNGDEPLVKDSVYDIAKRFAENANPAHVYFTGVGSTVRGGKVKLPYQMGSLDQVYEGEIADWVGNWQLQKEDIVITDKLDGTSVMVIYDSNGDLQIAYSRGNGVEGADWTRHIRLIPSVPKNVSRSMVVRAEVIIPIANFASAKTVQPSRSGKPYKNPRNMVSGIMNAKTNNTEIYQFVDVVAYEIVGNGETWKQDQIEQLIGEGFLTATYTTREGRELTDTTLSSYLNERRAQSQYEIDGLVLDVNDASKRREMNPTRSTLNPAYAVKYKVASADNVKNVRVVDVEWNVSKDRYLKPRVKIEPTELMGVTIQHATGFNAKFIKDNSIGKGAVIKITRSGDVIPFIIDVLEPGELSMPEGKWTETGVDLIATSSKSTSEAHFKSVVEFFTSIDAPNLKEGSIRKMFENGFETIEDIILADELDFIVAMGKNGQKAYEGLHARLNNIYVHDFIGSTPFFGRGVGKRKFKKLFEVISSDSFIGGKPPHADKIASAEGFDYKTAEKIVRGLQDFYVFWNKVQNVVTFTVPKLTGVTMEGQNVVFTGWRSKEFEAEVEANGGKMQTGVSKKTTLVVALDPNSKSGKAKKARDLGVLVIGVDEFKEML